MSESCAECRACCHDLVVRATAQDVRLEPRILVNADHEPDLRTWRLVPWTEQGRFRYRCLFLRGWGCEIYETRPEVCRRFTRGSVECRTARMRNGKEPIDDR
jgi:Fe-S-cluster containining protein